VEGGKGEEGVGEDELIINKRFTHKKHMSNHPFLNSNRMPQGRNT
jgi:hypothetical protein